MTFYNTGDDLVTTFEKLFENELLGNSSCSLKKLLEISQCVLNIEGLKNFATNTTDDAFSSKFPSMIFQT